jgi:acetyl-CoA acetyltransferase
MPRKSFVVGVGMTKFEKPGRRAGWDYPDIGREAATNALADAGIAYGEVQQAFLAYCYGDSTSGQRALYGVGLTGIPMVNVNNNCATGSTALYLANQYVSAGIADCVLALGFEKMQRGSLREYWDDRAAATGRFIEAMAARRGMSDAPPAPQLFGNAGREYMERYGVSRETIAKIAEKNHRHSVNNPYSQFRDEYSLEEILASPVVYDPLTKLQCCPTSDGGAAAVIASEPFVESHGLGDQAVEIVAQEMTTDTEETFDGSDANLVGSQMTRNAARAVYERSGLGPEDVQVIELHDCFSTNELVTYEALGLCGPGGAGTLIDEGAVDYGGTWVVNPSGGLISKGHPLGATGLAQCAELTWQLRGTAGARQVDGATVALQHNIGIGGAAVVTLYRKPEEEL